jgi:2-(1,2-epoxy-1,2-dihydrophenyl)acetyl-CoA isomerase
MACAESVAVRRPAARVPAASLAQETEALAARIAGGAPLAAAAAKRLIRAMDGMSYADAVTAEGQEQSALSTSEDAAEGIAAFLEKRKAQFRGC